MANNLGRLFLSAMEMSKPTLGLPCSRSQIPESARRLICYSNQQCHNYQDSPDKRGEPISENEGKIQNKKEQDHGDDDEDDGDGGIDLNKETGEVGGPRGPEPTRFGDWERNGRCYDF